MTDYPKGPIETALYFREMQRQAIVYPTDNTVVVPSVEKIYSRVGTALHREHTLPDERQCAKREWSHTLSNCPERFDGDPQVCQYGKEQPRFVKQKYGYTFKHMPTVDGSGRLPVPQDVLNTYRKSETGLNITHQAFKP